MSARAQAHSISRSSRRPRQIDRPTATPTRISDSASPPHPMAASAMATLLVVPDAIRRDPAGRTIGRLVVRLRGGVRPVRVVGCATPLPVQEPVPLRDVGDAPIDQGNDLAPEPF